MTTSNTSDNTLERLEQMATRQFDSASDLLLECIDGADFLAPHEGLNGIRPVLYYRITERHPEIMPGTQIWTRLFQSARSARQIPLAIRALTEKAKNLSNNADAARLWMALGHYFRFAAKQYSESARAYARAVKANPDDAVSAMLALQRLLRYMPDCEDAAKAIAHIRQQADIPEQSKETLETQLGQIAPNNNAQRTQALIDLATVMLTSYGDASRSLDWLETAYDLKADPMLITPVCMAIAYAIPDNTPILTRSMDLLIKCRAWRCMDKIAHLISCLDFVPADFEPLNMTLSMVYALQLNDEKRAAEELFNAALRNPDLWAKDIQQRAWICIYAAEHECFRRALYEGMSLVGSESLDSEIIAFYEKFSRSPVLRNNAIAMRMNLLVRHQNYDQIFKLIHQCINNGTTRDNPDFYDTLRDIISYGDSRQAVDNNLKIIDTAMKLYEADHNQPLALDFISDLIDAFSAKKDSDNYRILYKKSLDARMVIDPLNTCTPSGVFPEFSVNDNPPGLSQPSVNVAEIMRKSDSMLQGIDLSDLQDSDDISITMDITPDDSQDLNAIRSFDTLISYQTATQPAIASSSIDSLANIESADNLSTSDESQKFLDDLKKQDLSTEDKIQQFIQFDVLQSGLPIHGISQEQDSLKYQAYAFILEPDKPELRKKMLENIQATHAQWLDTANLLLRFLNAPDASSEIASAIADICKNHLQNWDAYDLLFNHFNLCLQHDVLFEQVLRMSDNANQKQQMLDKIDDAIAAFAGDTAQRNALLVKKYKIAEILGDERTRMSCLKNILETTPDNAFALHALNDLNPEKLSHHAQILYYQLRIYTEKDPGKKLEFQQVLVSLYMQTSQINNAISLYHTMIDEHPEYLKARYQLLELLISQENWKAAENVLLALINAETSTENKYQCLIRLAGIQNDKLFVSSRALLTLFSALDVDPYRINLLHPEMCKISEQLRSFSPLIDKYEDLVKHHKVQEIRRTVVLHLAHIYNDYLKKPAMACNVLDEYYRQEGASDPEFLRQAASFFGDMKHWNGYVRTIAQLIPQISDNRERVQLALAAAHVYAENLGDHGRAAQVALIAANSQPQTAAQWLEIADFLLTGEITPQAILALEHAVALENDQNKKIQLYLELARQYAMIDEIDSATNAFHTALQFKPNLELITPIAEDLIAHATAHKNKDAFVLLCHDLIASCPPSEQNSLLLQQALTLIRVYHDKKLARKIVDDNTERMTAIDLEQSLILAQILTLLHENDAAIRLVQSMMKRFVLDDEQQMACLKALLENASAIGDSATVQVAANAILKRNTKDTEARFYLTQLDYQAGRWDQASARIQDLIPDIELLSAENAMLVHFYYGEILHASQHDDLAIECLDNALRIRLDYRPAVDLKLTILLQNQRWPEALPVFNLLSELTDDPDEKGAIHKRIGEIYHFYIHDNDKAIREYEYAITLGGDVEDVPIRLLQLYADTKQWRNAAVTAQVLAQAQTDSPDAKCDYLIALGKIQFKHLEEYQQAIQTFSEAIEIQPLDSEIVEPLTQLVVRNQNWQDYENIVDMLAKHLDTDEYEATNRLRWIAQKCGKIEACKNALQRAQNALNHHNIDVKLFILADDPDPEWLKPLAQNNKRHRTNTQPGTISKDSGLSINPDLTPKPQSEQSLMKNDSDDQATKDDNLNEEDNLNEIVKKEIEKDKNQLNPNKQSIPPLRDITASIPPIASIAKLPSVTQLHLPSAKIETLSFTINDLHQLEKNAEDNNERFTLICLSDFMEHTGLSNRHIDPEPLPEELSDKMLQSLIMMNGSTPDPELSNILAALATQPESPLLADRPGTLDIQSQRPDLAGLFANLKNILMAPSIDLTAVVMRNPNQPLTNTQPPCIRCINNQVSSISSAEWIARMTYATLLARPESKLLFSVSVGQIAHDLIEISKVFRHPNQRKTTMTREKIDQWRATLASVGIIPSAIPVFKDDTLSKLKQLAAYHRRTAIQCALLLSQSLTSTMKLLSEIETCRCPNSIATLKSAMKQSSAMKSLVIFALSTNAQHLYNKIYNKE